jgi:hypothetical protein
VNCWKRAKWNVFQEYVKNSAIDFKDVNDNDTLNHRIDDLYKLISGGLEKAVPTRTLTTRYAAWWSPNLGLLSRRLCAAKKRLASDRNETHFLTWKQANKTWMEAVTNAKNRLWEQTMANANANNIWDIHKEHTRSIPDLENAVSFIDKVKALRTQFFTTHAPNPNDTLPDSLSSLVDLTSFYYRVDTLEVSAALQTTNLNAPPGQDQINVRTLRIIHSTNENILPDLVTKCLLLGNHCNIWKSTTMVMLPKLGNRGPHKPGSYRPISLNSTLGKLVEKIAAARIATCA